MIDTLATGVKVIAIVVVLLLVWSVRSRWQGTETECRDCKRCTEPILTRMWRGPALGWWRAVERLWLRACPKCRHRLQADHGYRDDGGFID